MARRASCNCSTANDAGGRSISRINLPRDQLNFLVVKDAAGHHAVELPDVEPVTSLGAGQERDHGIKTSRQRIAKVPFGSQHAAVRALESRGGLA